MSVPFSGCPAYPDRGLSDMPGVGVAESLCRCRVTGAVKRAEHLVGEPHPLQDRRVPAVLECSDGQIWGEPPYPHLDDQRRQPSHGERFLKRGQAREFPKRGLVPNKAYKGRLQCGGFERSEVDTPKERSEEHEFPDELLVATDGLHQGGRAPWQASVRRPPRPLVPLVVGRDERGMQPAPV